MRRARLTLRAQLAWLAVVCVVAVALVILFSLKNVTFEAFIQELQDGLRSQPYDRARVQRCRDLAHVARILGSDAVFVRMWRSARRGLDEYREVLSSLEAPEFEHPTEATRKRLAQLRRKNCQYLWDASQRMFLERDPDSSDRAPHTEYYGSCADLFVVADELGVVLMEIRTDSDRNRPDTLGRVPIHFPQIDPPEPHTLLLKNLSLAQEGFRLLDQGQETGVAGYFRYPDGHLYQGVLFPTISRTLILLADRVDDRLARQASLSCASSSVLFVENGQAVAGWVPTEPRGEGGGLSSPVTADLAGRAVAALDAQGWEEGSRRIWLGQEEWLAVLSPLDSTPHSLPGFQESDRRGPALGWMVLLKPTRILNEMVERQSRIATLVIAGMTLLAVGLAWALAGQAARPIQSLAGSLLTVAQGDLEVCLIPHGPREVVAAGEAFNQLVAGLKDKKVLEKFVRRMEELRKAADLSDPLVREQTQFGRFVVVERLGAGGMATVYRALPLDTLEDRDRVAIKVMHPQFAADPDFQARFQREYRVMSQLSHPGVVRVLDGGDLNGRLYIVMEFVEGESLSTRVTAVRQLPYGEFFQMAHQMLAALSYAHSQGVVHRDLKPDNLMVTPSGIKVMDFGLATGADMSRLTRSGEAMGTPAYIAPEQISGADPDQLADQYSLGIVFYEMLTGRRPFLGNDPMAVIHQQLASAPPPPHQFRGDLPGPLESILLRMLQKNPLSRFPDLRAVDEALANCAATPVAEMPTDSSGGNGD